MGQGREKGGGQARTKGRKEKNTAQRDGVKHLRTPDTRSQPRGPDQDKRTTEGPLSNRTFDEIIPECVGPPWKQRGWKTGPSLCEHARRKLLGLVLTAAPVG